MAKSIVRLHAHVYGRVQGVGFRFYTVDAAISLGLTGWVANRYDSVEVVAEGPHAALQQLLTVLNEGPSMSRVDQVQHQFLTATREYKRFSIEA